MHTLGTAARAVGKSKATISRAIKSGRLSASRSEDGSYLIDPAELHRVFPETGATGGDTGAMKRSATPLSVDGLDLAPLRETVAWQRLIAEQAETIRYLKQKLDATVEERRTERQQEAEERRRLLALLTDQRLRPWWRRWFR